MDKVLNVHTFDNHSTVILSNIAVAYVVEDDPIHMLRIIFSNYPGPELRIPFPKNSSEIKYFFEHLCQFNPYFVEIEGNYIDLSKANGGVFREQFFTNGEEVKTVKSIFFNIAGNDFEIYLHNKSNAEIKSIMLKINVGMSEPI